MRSRLRFITLTPTHAHKHCPYRSGSYADGLSGRRETLSTMLVWDRTAGSAPIPGFLLVGTCGTTTTTTPRLSGVVEELGRHPSPLMLWFCSTSASTGDRARWQRARQRFRQRMSHLHASPEKQKPSSLGRHVFGLFRVGKGAHSGTTRQTMYGVFCLRYDKKIRSRATRMRLDQFSFCHVARSEKLCTPKTKKTSSCQRSLLVIQRAAPLPARWMMKLGFRESSPREKECTVATTAAAAWRRTRAPARTGGTATTATRLFAGKKGFWRRVYAFQEPCPIPLQVWAGAALLSKRGLHFRP